MKPDKLNNAPIDVQASSTTEFNSESTASAGFEAEAAKKSKKMKTPNRFLFAALGLVALTVMIVVSGLFLILSGGDENPLAQSLGLTGTGVSGLIFAVMAFAFGAIALGGLVTGMLGIFKTMNTKKDDPKNKKAGLTLTIAGIILVIVGLIGSIFGFSQIYNVPVEQPRLEIIETNPEVTTGLTAPVSITFSAANVPIDTNQYSIVAYAWSFGDGNSGNGQIVTHTYQEKPDSGFYTVTLKVNYQELGDLGGEVLEQEYTRVIGIDNEQVFAAFTFTPEEGQAPLEVTFDASESRDPDGFIVRYEWDFSNNGIFDAEGMVATFTFDEPGNYPVTLRVTDNSGETNTVEHIVVVKSDEIIFPVVRNTPADDILVPGRAYQFDASDSASSEGEITRYEWNFGDGQIRSGRRVTHTFLREGVYEVSLKLTDSAGNTADYARNVTVSESSSGLFGSIATTPPAMENRVVGVVPLRVSFDAGGSSGGDIVDFQWDFENNGEIDATGQTAEHIFTRTGTFNTELTITSADGRSAKTTIQIVVEGSEFEARMTVNPLTGEVPLTVTFDATSSRVPQGEQIIAYRWNFGDGTPLLTTSDPIVSHRFDAIGTFNIKLTAVNSNNRTSETEANVVVTATPLRACFTMSRTTGAAPLSVNFNPQCTTGTINTYKWDFGGLANSNERRPTFTFTEPGEYEVILEVLDNRNNVSRFTDTVDVR